MRVLVLGASGGVGRHVVRLAVAAGHDVTAIQRVAGPVPAGVRLCVDDVGRDGVLDAAVADQDAVLSALGLKRTSPANPYSGLASPPDFASATARALVAAMAKRGVARVIAVSAAGVGDSAAGRNLALRWLLATSTMGAMYADLERMEAVYAASGLDACCVRPTTLTNGPATGRVREISDFPLTATITRADVAAWMVAHLTGEVPRHPTITGA